MTGKKLRQPRKRASLDDFLDEPPATEGPTYKKHDSAFKIRFETLPLRDVRLNYKNKRIITQLVRFIPDEIVTSAMDQSDISAEEYVLKNIKDIPINKIIHQHLISSGKIEAKSRGGSVRSDDDILNYPCHSDLYDYENEGVFIGKGLCFSNIKNSNEQLSELIHTFVDKVKMTGASLSQTNELTEIPAVFKTGGMHTLAFGHQRYCYLAFHIGMNEPYYFLLKTENEHQDRTIYLENNTKTQEHGYEQLLSSHFAIKDTDGSLEQVLNALSIKRTYYYKIKPFLEDIRLIHAVKKFAMHLSVREITENYSSIKQALVALKSNPSQDEVLDAFENKLAQNHQSEIQETQEQGREVLSETQNTEVSDYEVDHTQIKKSYVPVKIPSDLAALEKLFFEDVREWSALDTNDYDLKSKRGLKKYLSDLVDEISK